MNHPDTIINSDWFNKYVNVPQPAYISVDNRQTCNYMPNIFIQVEPNIIINNEDYLINNCERYHTIFTFNKNVLEKCKNAKCYVYGTTWIEKNQYENINISKKQYKISTLAGSKLINNSPGHMFRQLIHHNQLSLHYPITYFRSIAQVPHIHDYGNNPFLGMNDSATTPHNKFTLFEEYQFSIIIENSQQINYFTEKIMDCILTKTIPIYWGCPNISDFFDITGWIILDSPTIQELDKLHILDSTYYNKYINVIENNYNKALQYTDLYTNINNATVLFI